jgi:hypothetical protein
MLKTVSTQLALASDTLSEILAKGNTSGPNNIVMDSGYGINGTLGATTPATVAATTLSTTGAAAFGGAITASVGASFTGLKIGATGGGDAFAATPLAAGSGAAIAALNNTLADFEPLIITGETISLKTRTTFGNATDRVILDASGNLNLVSGNIIIGTSGTGIDFSATAGTGTSELLDDYEEGTWTPTVIGLTVSGTATYTGRYTKVGRLVSIDLLISSTGSTSATTGVTVFSVPYVQADTPRSAVSCSAGSPSTALLQTSYIYPPTWTSLANVWISGTYSV